MGHCKRGCKGACSDSCKVSQGSFSGSSSDSCSFSSINSRSEKSCGSKTSKSKPKSITSCSKSSSKSHSSWTGTCRKGSSCGDCGKCNDCRGCYSSGSCSQSSSFSGQSSCEKKCGDFSSLCKSPKKCGDKKKENNKTKYGKLFEISFVNKAKHPWAGSIQGQEAIKVNSHIGPTIRLYEGVTYVFNVSQNVPHRNKFYLSESPAGGKAYGFDPLTEGEVRFVPDSHTPRQLFYQSSFASNMGGLVTVMKRK